MSAAAALRLHVESVLSSRFEAGITPQFGWQQCRAAELLPTGVPAVDALAGGFTRGAITEIAGPTSSGRTSLLLSALAQAAADQEFCAFVDASDAFDPVSAARSGVDLARLIWVRCGGNAEHALKATDLLVQAGGFAIIALDLGGVTAQVARRISLASWFRLRHAAERNRVALVTLAQQINARSCSKLQLEMGQNRVLWSGNPPGKLLRGLAVEAEVHTCRKVASVRPGAFSAETFSQAGVCQVGGSKAGSGQMRVSQPFLAGLQVVN